jgi:hypothetical protein
MFSVSLALKLAGATLSAVLGVIALLGDFRDRESKRLTSWGRVTLMGLALGAVLTIGTELIEKKEQADEASKRLKETQELLRETQMLLRDSQSAQRRLEVLTANGQTLEARTNNLLSVSEGTLKSTREVAQSSYQLLAQQQRQQNPIKNQMAVAYRTMPLRSSETLKAFLASKTAEYLELIKSAAASGHAIQSRGSIAVGDLELPLLATKLYKPKPGITLQIDKSAKPVTIDFNQESELASLSGSKALFDTAGVTFSIWLAAPDPRWFESPSAPPANLILRPLPISNGPQPTIKGERTDPMIISWNKDLRWDLIDLWGRADPIAISWKYDFRRDVLWKFSSLRLTEAASDGNVASVLDLPGSTMAILGEGDVCYVDVYAGQYQYTIPKSQIRQYSTFFEVYFQLPMKPTYVPRVTNDLRLYDPSRPSEQPCR